MTLSLLISVMFGRRIYWDWPGVRTSVKPRSHSQGGKAQRWRMCSAARSTSCDKGLSMSISVSFLITGRCMPAVNSVSSTRPMTSSLTCMLCGALIFRSFLAVCDQNLAQPMRWLGEPASAVVSQLLLSFCSVGLTVILMKLGVNDLRLQSCRTDIEYAHANGDRLGVRKVIENNEKT